MKKIYMYILWSILTILFFSNISAQISEQQIKSEIERIHLTVDYALEPEWMVELFHKMKDNPDPYVTYIRNHLYLPEDKETLSTNSDTLSYYDSLLRILFSIGNSEAKDIVLQEYYKQINLLEQLEAEEKIAEVSAPDEEYDIISDATNNLTGLYIGTIGKFEDFKDDRIIADCLERFDTLNKVIGYTILQYFYKVAPNDPNIHSRLMEIYNDPNSQWYHYKLKKFVEFMSGEVWEEPGLIINLLNSQNTLIPDGQLKYYDGGWKDAVNNNDGTFRVETERPSVSLRMIYAFASQDMADVPVNGGPVTFQTIPCEVQLKSSQDQPIDEGTVKYYAGGWRDFGVTSEGVTVKELLSGSYPFRMTYGFASNDKSQDIGTDPVVVFQTIPVQVELRNSGNQLMDQGTVQYYAGGWREFGITSGGIAEKELLPNNYPFRMTYAYASNDKTQDTGTDRTVVFQTVRAEVRLEDSTGQPLGEGTVQYYAGGWRTFGNIVNGMSVKELLPNSYPFRMTYAYASEDKSQDIGVSPVVLFRTIKALVELRDSEGQLMDQGTVKYYSGGWREFGMTSSGTVNKELLPKSYTFRATFSGFQKDVEQDLSVNAVVEVLIQ